MNSKEKSRSLDPCKRYYGGGMEKIADGKKDDVVVRVTFI